MEFIIDLLAHGRWRVLNEPRGFIRILQWFLAIIAFALCCDYQGEQLLSLNFCIETFLPVRPLKGLTKALQVLL